MDRKSTWLRQFGVRVRVAREAAGLTQAEVADSVGTHRQTVYRWEQGTQAPDVWHLALLCDVLEVDPDQLIGSRLHSSQ